MTEAVKESRERSVEELIEGIRESMKDIKKGNTFSVEEFKEEIEEK